MQLLFLMPGIKPRIKDGQGYKEVLLMQEEANQKTVGIVVQAGKFTMHEFGRACEKYSQYRRDKKRMRRTDPTKYKVNQPKKIKVKQMMKEGESVKRVNLEELDVSEFSKIARKNGLRFAVNKDKSTNPPTYVVYFKARSGEAIDQTVDEYIRMHLSKKKTKEQQPKEQPKKQKQQETIHDKLGKFQKVVDENAAKIAKDKAKDIIR